MTRTNILAWSLLPSDNKLSFEDFMQLLLSFSESDRELLIDAIISEDNRVKDTVRTIFDKNTTMLAKYGFVNSLTLLSAELQYESSVKQIAMQVKELLA